MTNSSTYVHSVVDNNELYYIHNSQAGDIPLYSHIHHYYSLRNHQSLCYSSKLLIHKGYTSISESIENMLYDVRWLTALINDLYYMDLK